MILKTLLLFFITYISTFADVLTIEKEREKTVRNFILKYEKISNNRDINKMRKLYDTNINYYDKGMKSINEVFKDKIKYLNKWEVVNTNFISINSINKNSNGYIVEFISDFTVYNYQNKKGWRGKVQNKIGLNNGLTKITSEKGKVINKHSIHSINDLLECKNIITMNERTVKNNKYEVFVKNCSEDKGIDDYNDFIIIRDKHKERIYFNDNLVSFHDYTHIEFFSEDQLKIGVSDFLVTNNTILDLETLKSIDMLNGSLSLIKNGKYKGNYILHNRKVLHFEDGRPSGFYWVDEIVNIDLKAIKFPDVVDCKNDDMEFYTVSEIMGSGDVTFLDQPLNDCISVIK